MPTKTLLERAWDDPNGKLPWDDLVAWFEKVVYGYAYTKLRDPEAANGVTVDVFRKLHQRFLNRGAGPLTRTGFRTYLNDIVKSVVYDAHRAQERRTRRERESASGGTGNPAGKNEGAETSRRRADEAAVGYAKRSSQALDDLIDLQEALDQEVARCLDLYPQALANLRQEPRTIEVFLRVARGEETARLDREFGFETRRAGVVVYHDRVRNALIRRFGLPFGTREQKAFAKLVVQEVVKRHEQLHTRV